VSVNAAIYLVSPAPSEAEELAKVLSFIAA